MVMPAGAVKIPNVLRLPLGLGGFAHGSSSDSLGKGRDVFQIAFPACETFHHHEVIARHDRRLSSQERHSQGALVDGVEVERLLDEQVETANPGWSGCQS